MIFLQVSVRCRHFISTRPGPVVIQETGVHIPILQVKKQVEADQTKTCPDFPYNAPSPAPRPQYL